MGTEDKGQAVETSVPAINPLHISLLQDTSPAHIRNQGKLEAAPTNNQVNQAALLKVEIIRVIRVEIVLRINMEINRAKDLKDQADRVVDKAAPDFLHQATTTKGIEL